MSDNLAEPTFDVDAAKKVIENEKRDREARGGRDLEAWLAERKLTLLVVPVFVPDGRGGYSVGGNIVVRAVD